MSSLKSQLKLALAGVHPGWKPYLREAKVVQVLKSVLEDAAAKGAKLSPPPVLVLEAFRYFGPDDARVVILGQDPYPTGAQGLCFSCDALGSKVKDSLRAIVDNLAKHRQASACQFDLEKPGGSGSVVVSGDLRTWALQGVLMLNAALTTLVGQKKAHTAHWAAFTRSLLGQLSEHAAKRGMPLVAILWGNDAKGLQPALDLRTLILGWRHPSPLANNKSVPEAERFLAHTHFATTNEYLRKLGRRPVVWDPLHRSLVFTDGACSDNGGVNARASFAVCFANGPLKGTKVSGVVAASRYALNDANDPIKGFHAVLGGYAPPEGTPPKTAKNNAAGGGGGEKEEAPTNNRGEYLAGCWALLLLLRSEVRGRCEIVTDSKLFRDTMEEWLPARRRKGTAAELKNFDLVEIAEALLARLRARVSVSFADTGVAITHVRSHRPEPPREPRREWVLWRGNQLADELAAASQQSGEKARPGGAPNFVVVDSVLAWRLFGRYGENGRFGAGEGVAAHT